MTKYQRYGAELSARFDAILRHYAALAPVILAGPSDDWAVDAYSWDTPASGIRMSPIERALWGDIREQNMVMYPQWPVSGYFVDFANPVAKVAIECDGAAFHVDAKRDAIRQRHLEDKGWTVYRISGSDCMQDERVHEDDEGREIVTSSPAWQFLLRIGGSHAVVVNGRGGGGPKTLSEIMGGVLARIEQRAQSSQKGG